MAIVNSLVRVVSSGTEQGFVRSALYTYTDSEPISAIIAADYFSNITRYTLEVDDIILTNSSDGFYVLKLSSPTTAYIVDTNSGYTVQKTGSTINVQTDLYINSDNQTLTMPTVNTALLTIKSLTGFTATLDPGTNTFEGGTTVVGPASRQLYLDGTVWLDV